MFSRGFVCEAADQVLLVGAFIHPPDISALGLVGLGEIAEDAKKYSFVGHQRRLQYGSSDTPDALDKVLRAQVDVGRPPSGVKGECAAGQPCPSA